MDYSLVLELISHWAVQAFAVVFGALVLDFIQRRLMTRLLIQARTRTKNMWDDALVASIKSPLSLLIWVLGISFAAGVVAENSEATVFQIVPAGRALGVVAAFAWFLMLAVRNAELAYLSTERGVEPVLDRATVNSIARLLRISHGDYGDSGGPAEPRFQHLRFAGFRRRGWVGAWPCRERSAGEFLWHPDDFYGPTLRRGRLGAFSGQGNRRRGGAYQLAPHPHPHFR